MLEGQVAMVTGGGRGIGRAIAMRLAHEGADIAIVDLARDAAESTARDVVAVGRRAVAKAIDVSDHDAVKHAVEGINNELGRLDVLVNNAGVEKKAPFLEISQQDWRLQLDVNLSGTFYCTQAAAAAMAARGYGRIINISSVAGVIGPIDLAAYGASKAA
jgi:NAD(P)-dependent dehydrogenase (short-subunit alcohol dehydrogenase family)